jgi:hypothetical protein
MPACSAIPASTSSQLPRPANARARTGAQGPAPRWWIRRARPSAGPGIPSPLRSTGPLQRPPSPGREESSSAGTRGSVQLSAATRAPRMASCGGGAAVRTELAGQRNALRAAQHPQAVAAGQDNSDQRGVSAAPRSNPLGERSGEPTSGTALSNPNRATSDRLHKSLPRPSWAPRQPQMQIHGPPGRPSAPPDAQDGTSCVFRDSRALRPFELLEAALKQTQQTRG